MTGRKGLPGIVGLAVVTAAVVGLLLADSSGARGSPSVPAALAHGAVDRAGLPEGPAAGWHVAHSDLGRYVLALPAGTTDVDVTSWDAVSDVIVAPHGDGTFDVIFSRGGERLDTRFRFVAR